MASLPTNSITASPTVRPPTSTTGTGGMLTTAVNVSGTGASSPGNPSLAPLEPTPYAVSTSAAGTGSASVIGTNVPVATASDVGTLAGITNGQINSNDSSNSAAQLDAITNANSPYIQLAKQQGLLTAASRGLENSSLGAGASEAAAVQAALPMAQQNAQENAAGQMQNSQLNTQTEEFNKSQQNSDLQMDAQTKTQVSEFNAGQVQQNNQVNAAAVNAMHAQTQTLIEDMNKTFLAGAMAQTLAGINGQWNTLISSNTAAAGMYKSYLDNIGAMMNNKDLSPDRVQAAVTTFLNMLNGGLKVIDSMSGGTANSGVVASPYPAPTPPKTPIGGKR